MSYRDLRNFSEAMRVLGFPRSISVESFRVPNWELLEECLRWLAARAEPEAVLAGGRDTLETRLAMVTHAVALFHSRANLKLNGKKLYGADGWAVRELLKVATLLRAALQSPEQADLAGDAGPLNYDVTSRLGEIKQARALATDITAQGALLYDLLAKEPQNKDHREQAVSRQLDLSSLESSLRRALSSVAASVIDGRERISSVASSEVALDAKLERRRAELVRAEKRLNTVHKIKPAYQGELSQLLVELESLWGQYSTRFRCVEALKHQLATLDATHAEAAEEQQAAIMQLIHKYETEDVLGKLSESDELDSSDDDKDLSEQPRPATRPKTRLRIKTASGAAMDARLTFGSMAARDSLDDIRDEDSPTESDDDSDNIRYASGSAAAAASPPRWPRPRARPATRTLLNDDDYTHIQPGGEIPADDSLGSSSESELRMTSARPSAQPGRNSALSDNEF